MSRTITPIITQGKKHPKGWGYELHIENNQEFYSKQ